MSEPQACPKCGAPLPGDAPAGLCPKCLLQAGLVSERDAPSAPPAEERTASPLLSSPFVPPPPGDLAGYFPQLEIVELIGSGGMGAVYKARQPHLDRFVALKVLPPEVGADPAFAERFAREARALARLNHPHIVAVYDFGRTAPHPDCPSPAAGAAGLHYLLMEYVDGTNLRELIAQGKLKPEEALAIVPQVCEALQYAHDEGVVHRDIKPENILLDSKGRVKIADFGLARILARPSAEAAVAAGKPWTLTGTGQVMGTPNYMAPEQLRGSHAVDHRADIYSLGVVFYEMLTGELPVGRFEPPSKKAAVDARLDEVVLRALESAPERRYQKASDVRTDVEAISAVRGPGLPGVSAAPLLAAAGQDAHVRQRITASANGLFLAGVVSLLASLAIVLWACWTLGRLASMPTQKQTTTTGGMTITFTPKPQGFPPPWVAWVLLVSQTAGMAAAGVTLFAALSMRKHEHYRICQVGCGLAMVPCSPGWLVGLPLGLRALLTLQRPDVRQAFEAPWPPPAGADETPPLLAVSRPAALAMIVTLLGALGTFLPWATLTMFGFTELLAGFDDWHGIVCGLVFLVGFFGLLTLAQIRAPARWHALLALLTGLITVPVAAAFLWGVFRGPQFNQTGTQETGPGADILKPLAESLLKSMFAGIEVRPHVGPFIVLALGMILLVLAGWQLLGWRQSRKALPAEVG
jgi:hypothetical protein